MVIAALFARENSVWVVVVDLALLALVVAAIWYFRRRAKQGGRQAGNPHHAGSDGPEAGG